MKNCLWSMSTTIRNPERIKSFLETAKEIEGEIWNKETQVKYQILLIKTRHYRPETKGLPDSYIKILNDYRHSLS